MPVPQVEGKGRVRGHAVPFAGESSVVGKGGKSTENLADEVMTRALGLLKSIIGSSPAEE